MSLLMIPNWGGGGVKKSDWAPLIDAKKSTGHDGFSILIIEKLAAELSVPLTLIFNMSIKDGIVPDQLKIARVVPIHKKESKDNFTNYRPISVLPGFSKILERLVFNRCISFLNKHNILYENQFGFRPRTFNKYGSN